MSSDTNGIGADRLRSFIERIERLQEEKAAIQADIKEVKAEAKGEGFDLKAINQILKERKMDPGDRQEFEAVCDLYRQALGMLGDTPLGEAAVEEAVRKARKDFLGAVAKNDGDSITITGPDGRGTKISNKGGKKVVEAVAKKGAEPVPGWLASARGIVREAGAGKLDAMMKDAATATVTVKKSDTARGSVEKALWAADEALLAAGFSRAGGNDYTAPAEA